LECAINKTTEWEKYMYKRLMIALAAMLLLALVGCNKAEVVEKKSMELDRNGLIGITKTYLSAIVAHNPSAAPLAENIAFVENITKMKPGEGLWKSAVSAPSSFAIYVPDEKNQSAGFLGMMTYMAPPPPPPAAPGAKPKKEAAPAAAPKDIEQPVLVALRLTLKDGKIMEAEHLLAGITGANLETLKTPRSGLVTEVPAAQRKDHDELIKIGASYYDALDDNDGTLMPFAPDCERHENGMITAGANAGAGPNNAGTGKIARDCAGQLTSKVMSYIGPIENRRVFAADPVTGLVMGLSHFRHPMNTGAYEVINMDGTKGKFEMKFAPFDLPAAHIYKIGADGKVHEIEAMGFMAPYNAPTGWEK
jgi:hypothetical protein